MTGVCWKDDKLTPLKLRWPRITPATQGHLSNIWVVINYEWCSRKPSINTSSFHLLSQTGTKCNPFFPNSQQERIIILLICSGQQMRVPGVTSPALEDLSAHGCRPPASLCLPYMPGPTYNLLFHLVISSNFKLYCQLCYSKLEGILRVPSLLRCPWRKGQFRGPV